MWPTGRSDARPSHERAAARHEEAGSAATAASALVAGRPRRRHGRASPSPPCRSTACSARRPAMAACRSAPTEAPIKCSTAPSASASTPMSIAALPWSFAPGAAAPSTSRSARRRLPSSRRPTTSTLRSPARPSSTCRPSWPGATSPRSSASASSSRRLPRGASVEMPVTFFVDPKIVDDEDTKNDLRDHLVLHLLPQPTTGPASPRRRRRQFGIVTRLSFEAGAASTSLGGTGANHGRSARQTTTRLSSRQSEPVARSSARVGALTLAIGALLFFISKKAGTPHLWYVHPGLRHRHRHHVRLVARRHQGGARGLRDAGRAAPSALRHDPVHRLRGDVLRRLVLGLFRRGALSRRVPSPMPRTQVLGGQWPPIPSADTDVAGSRLVRPHLQSLGSAARQHADPAHLGHDGDLGASLAAARATGAVSSWALLCTVVLGILFTTCQAYEYTHAGFAFAHHIYGSTFFMATGFHGFHVIVGTIFLTVCLIRAMRRRFHAEAAFRLRGRRLVLALRRRGVAVPVHLHLCVGRRQQLSGRLDARIAHVSGGRSCRAAPFSFEDEARWAMRRHEHEPTSFGVDAVGRDHRTLPVLRSRQAVCRLSHARSALQCLRARLQLRRFRRRTCRLRHPGDRLHRGRRGADRRDASTRRLIGCTLCCGVRSPSSCRSSCFGPSRACSSRSSSGTRPKRASSPPSRRMPCAREVSPGSPCFDARGSRPADRAWRLAAASGSRGRKA